VQRHLRSNQEEDTGIAYPELMSFTSRRPDRFPTFARLICVCILVLSSSTYYAQVSGKGAGSIEGTLLSHVSFAQSTPGQTVPSSVPASRLAHIRHGINLSGWFAQVYDAKGYTKEHFESYVTSQDIALIKSMGFDHVRLSVNPEPMFRSGHADELPPEYLGNVDAAVNLVLKSGLAIMIDIHPDAEFKNKLANNDNFVPEFVYLWRGLARHYASFDPDLVFFEILNEPEMRDRYRWQGIQAKVAAAIRDAAPRHTIIATGARWSADDELLFLEPLPDPNVIYDFHFYEPHVFTHQGATWGENYWHSVQGLAYPSNRVNTERAAANVPDEINRLYVLRYGMESWNRERIQMEIRQVSDWGKRRQVPVICNEFGVYRNYADPQARAAWIRDVRMALEDHNMGWTMWDYSGGFGVVTLKDGRPVPDQQILKALGLR
jgi:endoglucanase